MGKEQSDVVVIGAGVIGLAIARALARKGRHVLMLESHPGIGMETSSRNSEVIHAGLHYAPGSLKARTCLQGKESLYAYCQAKGVPHRRIGKLIVAVGEEQLEVLEQIRANAEACGVTDLECLDSHRLELLEPEVRAAAALWSPSTGIIDSHALMLALQGDLEAAGGQVVCHTRVTSGRVSSKGLELQFAGNEPLSLSARTVINSAGLYAAEVARSLSGLPAGSIPAVHLVRGHYFTYSGNSPFQHLIYPLPEAGGLGIHGTLDLAGQLRFGPDTQPTEHIDYDFDENRLARFSGAIRKWFPELQEARLQPGYVGIRPRLALPGDGFRDFVVSGPADHGIPGLINLYGIESPGLTACLALADFVTAMVMPWGSEPDYPSMAV